MNAIHRFVISFVFFNIGGIQGLAALSGLKYTPICNRALPAENGLIQVHVI